MIKEKARMPLPAGFYLSKEMGQFETFAIPDEVRPILAVETAVIANHFHSQN